MNPTNSTSEPELKQLFTQLLEPYFAKYHREKCYAGLVFEQGRRKMVQINVPAHDLPILLQAKPSENNDPDSGKNRPVIQGHAEEIKNYILDRIDKNKPWILGTLTANVDPGKIEIVEFTRGFCLVIIPRGVKLDITDGQHRKSAIHDLIESAEGELIGDNDFPITLVLEKEKRQCQTDFRDMAQTRQLDKSLLLSFGEYQGRVGITKNLIESVSMFRGKTEKIKATPSTKQKLIYTTNYIAKAVSRAITNDSYHELKEYDVDELSEVLTTCFNHFFSECHSTKYIAETEVKDLNVDAVDRFKQNCVLGTSAGLEVLGGLLYKAYQKDENYFDLDQVAAIAQLDWSREGKLWQGNIVVFDSNNPAKGYKMSASINSVKTAESQAKYNLGW